MFNPAISQIELSFLYLSYLSNKVCSLVLVLCEDLRNLVEVFGATVQKWEPHLLEGIQNGRLIPV